MKKQSYQFFGMLSLALAISGYVVIARYTDWNSYRIWIVAISAVTFAIYGLDKAISKINEAHAGNKTLPRTPENLLHLLALLGGFPGGWFGMIFFGHKTNFRKHPSIWFFLSLGTALHVVLDRSGFLKGR